MKLYKFFTAIGVIALAAGFTSCSDDDEVYTDGFGGVEGQVVLAPTLNESYKFIKIPTGVVAPEISWSVAPRSRVRATEDLTMKFEIDNSLIEAYNLENNADYVALPDGIVTMDVSEATITPGNTSAESSVSLKMTEDAALLGLIEVGKEYLVPVRMTAVTQGTARIAVSADNTSYITFSVSEELIKNSGNPTGTIVAKEDRVSWHAIPGDGAEEWYSWDEPIQETGDYNFGNYPVGSSVTFDLGKEYSFDGIYSYPFYGQSQYALLKVNSEIFISSDGNDWTLLGVLGSTRTTVALYATVQARYIKVVLGSGNQIATTAFSIYEK